MIMKKVLMIGADYSAGFSCDAIASRYSLTNGSSSGPYGVSGTSYGSGNGGVPFSSSPIIGKVFPSV